MYLSFVFILLGAIVFITSAQIPQDLCISKISCHECIETPSCAWCSDPKINATNRCFQPDTLPPPDSCDLQFILNPDNEIYVLANIALSAPGIDEGGTGAFFSSSGSSGSSGSYGRPPRIVQIQPQKLRLKLRAKQTYNLTMHYAQAEDYPLDLYYLMDLSKSMEDDKVKLSALGDHLVNTMKNMTTNFRVGFGGFVDKVVMPYVSTIPEKLRSPCEGCAAPYGFRNLMSLSQNTSSFPQMVKDAPLSGNLDSPEGGLDGVMQVVVCQNQIGWKQHARRFLVLASDAGFHYAGDGKLGGIVKPNDGRCHLDQYGLYTESSKQDYPSVSQINTNIKKNGIHLIFALTADQIEICRELQSQIEGLSCAQLSHDSSNVVELIKDEYNKISSTVEWKHNASSPVKIKFFTKCLNQNGELVETNKCGDFKVGDRVEFLVELEVLECPKDPKDWQQTIQIRPVGIPESLVIDLQLFCDCQL